MQGGDPKMGIAKLMQSFMACPGVQDTASKVAGTCTEQFQILLRQSGGQATPLNLIFE